MSVDEYSQLSDWPDDFTQQAKWSEQPSQAIKGRGAASRMAGRFETQKVELIDDGWAPSEDDDGFCPRLFDDASLKTTVTEEYAKSIISRNQSPDLPFHQSVNPYRGCEHGCVYCFARPTHAYLGLSPGLDFESRLYAKINAPALLTQELARASYKVEPIALGINTDAYQPCEREYRLTRQLLQIFHDCNHPVGLITKSSLIERDIDLLKPMAEKHLAVAGVTLTTLDHDLARKLEPRAASPRRRLETIRKLTAAGIPVAVSIAPVIPFITEQELEQTLTAAVEAGATSAGYTVIRLPHEVSPLFEEWLQVHFPERAARVLHRIRDMRQGKNYHAEFGSRMRGEGVWADMIKQRFDLTRKRLGIEKQQRIRKLDCDQFKRPKSVVIATDKHAGQISLF